jgi:hypothetical protein
LLSFPRIVSGNPCFYHQIPDRGPRG